MGGRDPGSDPMDAIIIFDQVMSTADPCVAAWEEVGLSALRPSLDQQALAIAENQEASLENRKTLAAQAKAFRVSVEDEFGVTSDMRAASGALVRSFKAEIDSLTTRSRFAENAFLALYKLLREAPDPAVTVKALEGTARAAFEALESQNRSLDEQRQEASRQLEALRASAAARGGGSLTPEELQEERRVLREEIAAEQAETEQARLQALQDALQEELLMAQRQAEHERAAGQAQLQVLQQEVERMEARAAIVEEEAARAAALEEGASARAELLRTLKEKVESLEAEHEAISTSAEAAFRARDEAAAKFEEAQAREKSAEREAEERARALEAEVFQLRRELETRADASQVEAMREQIRILEGIWGGDPDEPANALHGHGTPDRGGSEWTVLTKGGEAVTKTDERYRAQSERRGGVMDAVEHGGEGESRIGNPSGSSKEGGRGITEGEGTDSGERGEHEGMNERVGDLGEEAAGNVEEGGRGTGVDAWLISYNRRLKNELQRLRNKARLAEERLEEAEEKRAADATELVERRNEVKRLEQDLVDAHQVVEAGKTMLRAFQSGAVSKQFGKLIGKGGRGATLVGVADDEAEARRGMDEELMEEGGAVAGVPGSEGFSAADRLLGAVKRQRDRFRKEALRREREASIAKGNAEHLARDNQELRRENMHLYKKMRYVMSYGGKGGDDPDVSSEANRGTERKYERLYEDGLDPFKEFDSQEKAARRNQMGVVERWLLWASGAVLRNRLRRYLLVLYLVILHAMLIMMRS